ncbi:MAG: histidine kinase [Bacteroidota bacterium]
MIISVGGIVMPEIIFAYYILYVAYEWPSKSIGLKLVNLLLLVIVFTVCVILIKLLGQYIFNNWVYEKKLARKETWDFAILLRSVVYFGFSSGLALSLKLFRKYKKAAEREKLLTEERLSVELKLLRNQLHPHFLFNTLNNIYSLTRKKSDLAPDAVLKLSDLLDFMLYRSETDTIPLANEIKFLEDFIALEKIRYSNRLSIHFMKNIDDPSTQIIPLVLLPLVENAFKHGASETQNEIFIRIKIVQKDEEIFFSIENSYDSIASRPFNGSIGLKNVSRRLKLLYKNHKIEIAPLHNIFKVNLYLDLKSYGKA